MPTDAGPDGVDEPASHAGGPAALAGPPATASRTRPLVIAHRGASADVPEHTLAAYEQAISDGADGLECDVRLTRDRHLVCVHDRTVNRTSNGRGAVRGHSLAQLRALDFGAPAPQAGERGVLTLARLLELVVDAPRRVELAIEVKGPTPPNGVVERALAELLGRHGLLRPAPAADSLVRVMSFGRGTLRRIGALAPAVPRVLLLGRLSASWTPLRSGPGRRPIADIVGPGVGLVRARPDLIRRLRAAGYPAHVWTVDEITDLSRCLALGVEAVITNRPRFILGHLDSGQSLNWPNTANSESDEIDTDGSQAS